MLRASKLPSNQYLTARTMRCTKCEREFPWTREFFNGDTRSPRGLLRMCKSCRCKRHRKSVLEWQKRNRNKMRAIWHKWYHSEKGQAWYRNRRERYASPTS